MTIRPRDRPGEPRGVDLLINDAGIFGAKPFLGSTEEELERFFTTNVKGAFPMTQAVVPLMIEGGSGSILNIGTTLVGQATAATPTAAERGPHCRRTNH